MSDYNSENNLAVWFDIPVENLDRAISFYSKITRRNISKEKCDNFEFATFEHDKGNGSCLVVDPENISNKGSLIYINVNGYIKESLSKVEVLGGKIVSDITPIGEYGYRAIILDSEGNRIALHSA